jgi:hypothetical protein
MFWQSGVHFLASAKICRGSRTKAWLVAAPFMLPISHDTSSGAQFGILGRIPTPSRTNRWLVRQPAVRAPLLQCFPLVSAPPLTSPAFCAVRSRRVSLFNVSFFFCLFITNPFSFGFVVSRHPQIKELLFSTVEWRDKVYPCGTHCPSTKIQRLWELEVHGRENAEGGLQKPVG